MDLRALAKLVALKAADYVDLDELLNAYGVKLSFKEKAELAQMLPEGFVVVYDVVKDRFIIKRR
ncbi:MAG: hypothetical protein TU35_005005 [Thermoproteus sp. AZ2]|jgi:hypothetical protein|uniref:Uncharacterized protein n=1 Tax=Thermoproteus sp. AZ2 TaxID=1609232 RepID=A0ACC6V1J1_9CREN|nr:MAG: hypothetical protein TU35_04180 [Thermoproteus sp. AZ2]